MAPPSVQGRVAALLLLCSAAASPATWREAGGDFWTAASPTAFVDVSATLSGAPAWTSESPSLLCSIPPFKPAISLGPRLSRPMRRDLKQKAAAQALVDRRFKADCRKIIVGRNAKLGALAKEWRSLNARQTALERTAADYKRSVEVAAAVAVAAGRKGSTAAVIRATAAERTAAKLYKDAEAIVTAAAARSRRTDDEAARLRDDVDSARADYAKALAAIEVERDAAAQRTALVKARIAAARKRLKGIRRSTKLAQKQAQGVSILAKALRRTHATLEARLESLANEHHNAMSTLADAAAKSEEPVAKLQMTFAKELDAALAASNGSRPLETEIKLARRESLRADRESAKLNADVLAARASLRRNEALKVELTALASKTSADIDAMVQAKLVERGKLEAAVLALRGKMKAAQQAYDASMSRLKQAKVTQKALAVEHARARKRAWAAYEKLELQAAAFRAKHNSTLAIIEHSERVIARETNATEILALRTANRSKAASAELTRMRVARDAADTEAKLVADAAEGAKAENERVAESNTASLDKYRAELERRRTAEAAAAARRGSEGQNKAATAQASGANLLAQARALASEEREIVNNTVHQTLLIAQARQEMMTIEARMRASAAASAARMRAQQKQLEYVRGAMEQAAEESAGEEAKAAAAKAGAAEAAKDVARLKRQRDADQAMEAKAAESAGAMKSGMDDLKEAINQAAINSGAGTGGGTLATVIAVADAVQKMEAALVSLKGDREALADSVTEAEKRAEAAVAEAKTLRSELLAMRERWRKQKAGTTAGAGAGDATSLLFSSLVAEKRAITWELSSLEDEMDRLRDNGNPNGPATFARQLKRALAVEAIKNRGSASPSPSPPPPPPPLTVGAPVRIAVASGKIVPPGYTGPEETVAAVIRDVIRVPAAATATRR